MGLIGDFITPPGVIMPLLFEDLPLTEAEADATYFVCEMKGGSDTNEIGVGAGLSEANRTLTRFGTVGAASSDWRAVSAASGFDITSAWADAFIRNAGGFSMLWHMKDSGGSGPLSYLVSSSPSDMYINPRGSGAISAFGTGKFGTTFQARTATVSDIVPASGEFWILISVDYTNELAFVGIAQGATQPSTLTDFTVYAVSTAPQAPIASAITLTANYFSIIGSNAATGEPNTTFSVKSLTAKLGASVTLA